MGRLIVSRGIARRHRRVIPRTMTREVLPLHGVYGSSHVSQTLIGIFENDAMRTATAKVMQFMSQNHFELKCRRAVTLGRRRKLL